MKYVRTRHHSFTDFFEKYHTPGNDGKISTQLIKMYNVVKDINNPVILELGTGSGQATTVFLQACEEKNGKTVSIDIYDFSDVTDSEKWTFIKCDSCDTETIFREAPYLKEGIDLLYIDSHHKREQVQAELETWFPYMKSNSHIFFDDVDANPYRKGNRKDNFGNEKDWNEIKDYIISFFHSNEDKLYLDISYGSTGLAHLYKISPFGTKPNLVKSIYNRKNNLLNNLIYNAKVYYNKIKSRLTS